MLADGTKSSVPDDLDSNLTPSLNHDSFPNDAEATSTNDCTQNVACNLVALVR